MEFGSAPFLFSRPEAPCDVLVLAGDIVTKENLDPLRMFADRAPHVVFVAGNHEHWRGKFRRTLEKLHSFAAGISNFHFLENEAIVINNQRFIGCTLWYQDTIATSYRFRGMEDFKRIKGSKERFRTFIYRYAAQSKRFLEQNVQEGDVVVTHVPPSEFTVRDRADDPLNVFYFNPCEEMVIFPKKPKLWICGHSHSSFDGEIYETRIVRNPFGYFGHETNPDFDRDLTITI